MSLGPTQQLVLCALDDHETRNSYEVAEYMSHYQREVGCSGSTPSNEEPAARRALDRLHRRGLVQKLDVQFPRIRWAITDAGRAALEASDG